MRLLVLLVSLWRLSECGVPYRGVTVGFTPFSAPVHPLSHSQYHVQNLYGQYMYGYATGLSAHNEVRTSDGVTRGGYSYIDANGVLQTVQYVSDPVHGFRVLATNLPHDVPAVAHARAQHLATFEHVRAEHAAIAASQRPHAPIPVALSPAPLPPGLSVVPVRTASVVAHPLPVVRQAAAYAPAVLPVSSQFHAQDNLGQYTYGYAGPLASKTETKTADGVTRGGYSYIDANGILQTVQYVSDPVNGFRVAATNLPKAPAVTLIGPKVSTAVVGPSENAALVAPATDVALAAPAPIPIEHAPIPIEHAPFPIEHAPVPGEHAHIPLHNARIPLEQPPIPIQYARIPQAHVHIPQEQLQHAHILQEHGAVPLQHAHIPQEHGAIPLQHAHVPLEHAHIPQEHASLPLQHAHMPLEYAHVPQEHIPHQYSPAYPESVLVQNAGIASHAHHEPQYVPVEAQRPAVLQAGAQYYDEGHHLGDVSQAPVRTLLPPEHDQPLAHAAGAYHDGSAYANDVSHVHPAHLPHTQVLPAHPDNQNPEEFHHQAQEFAAANPPAADLIPATGYGAGPVYGGGSQRPQSADVEVFRQVNAPYEGASYAAPDSNHHSLFVPEQQYAQRGAGDATRPAFPQDAEVTHQAARSSEPRITGPTGYYSTNIDY